jgi:hypothetical protein
MEEPNFLNSTTLISPDDRWACQGTGVKGPASRDRRQGTGVIGPLLIRLPRMRLAFTPRTFMNANTRSVCHWETQAIP